MVQKTPQGQSNNGRSDKVDKPALRSKSARLTDMLTRLVTPSPTKIGGVVIIFCLVSLLRHFQLPRDADARFDWVGVSERTLFDVRFKLRGNRPVSGEIGILAADEKSVAQFGRWPFPRSIYQQAMDNLKKAGVQWLAFDAVFSEDERPYLDESFEGIQSALTSSLKGNSFSAEAFENHMNTMLIASRGDVSFGQAIKDFDKVIQGFFFLGVDQSRDSKAKSIADLGYDWIEQAAKLQGSSLDFMQFPPQKSLVDYPELIYPGALANTMTIAGESKHQGFFSNNPDPDGIIRRATLVQATWPRDPEGNPVGDPFLVPSLALKTAAEYLGRVPLVSFDEAGISGIKLMDPSGEAEPVDIPTSLDGSGRMLINHYGDERTFTEISLADAYNNDFSSLGSNPMPKILLFGATAVGMNDQRPSPFSETIDGVNHHAAVLENILSKNFMKRTLSSFPLEVGLLIFSGIGFAALLSLTSAVTSALGLVGFCVALYFVDRLYMFGSGNWIYVGLVYFQNISIYFGMTLFRYFSEEKEKKKIKNAFQHYLNPAVINELLEHPEQLQLGGQKKELTVFFSDVRGFTTISETLSPEALTALLNEYFTPMTKLILESSGLLDKYIGDAIMAVWGAPIPLDDHADRALSASLAMLDELAVLQQKWKRESLPPIDIGIGLNTGQMVVGNMGSDQRFDYTVLGDAVNLGARLEAINKQYGTRILISEFVLKRLKRPESYLIREIDKIKVKGKNESVVIYEGVHSSGKNIEQLREVVGLFELGLGRYRVGDWDGAIKHFNQGLLVLPEDQPSQIFVDRCELLKAKDPGQDWDGVWVMTSK
jgi:adenylate cyclase